MYEHPPALTFADVVTVCMSLLRDMGQDGWIPGVSTIYQVLVSIQSLMFSPDVNPKRVMGEGAAYNKGLPHEEERIQAHMVKFALLPWLSKTQRNPIWNQIIDTYFPLHARKILNAVKDNRILRKYQVGGYREQSIRRRFGRSIIYEEQEGMTRQRKEAMSGPQDLFAQLVKGLKPYLRN